MKDIVEKLKKYAVYCIGFFLTATMLLSCDRYKYIGIYNEGLACVLSSNGKYGFIDMDKKEVIPCIYLEESGFSKGYTIVSKEKGKYGLIDKSGTEVIPCQYKFIENSFIAFSWRVVSDGKYGIFDLEKKDFFLPCKYEEIRIESLGKEKWIKIKLNDKYGLIDFSGKEILPCIYDKLQSYTIKNNGVLLVQLNGKKGIINKAIEEIIPCKYDYIGSFNDNQASISLNDKHGYIDITTGKEIIPCKYDNIRVYGEYRLATLKNETIVFDKQGKKIDIRFGTMRFGSNNPMHFVDTETGRQLSYSTIVVDDTKVVKTRLVREQGAEMVEFTLVASKLIGTRQEGSTTISTYSGSKTVSYSLGTTFSYELSKGVLKISK